MNARLRKIDLNGEFQSLLPILEADSVEKFKAFLSEHKIEDLNQIIGRKNNSTKLITLAVHKGCVRIVKFLLDQKCELDQLTHADDPTELSRAIFWSIEFKEQDKHYNFSAVAAMLLCHGANPEHPSVRTSIYLHNDVLFAMSKEYLRHLSAARLLHTNYPEESIEYYEAAPQIKSDEVFREQEWLYACCLMRVKRYKDAALVFEKNFDKWEMHSTARTVFINKLEEILKTANDQEARKVAARALQSICIKLEEPELARRYAIIATEQIKSLQAHQQLWEGICHLYQLDNKHFSPRFAIQLFKNYINENERKDIPSTKEAKFLKALAIAHCIAEAQKNDHTADQEHFIRLFLNDCNFVNYSIDIHYRSDLIMTLLQVLHKLNNKEHFHSLFNVVIQLGFNKNINTEDQERMLEKIQLLLNQKQETEWAWRMLILHLKDQHDIALNQKNDELQKCYLKHLISLQDAVADKPDILFSLNHALAVCYSRYNDEANLKLAIEHFKKARQHVTEYEIDLGNYRDALSRYINVAKMSDERLMAYRELRALNNLDAQAQLALLDEKEIPIAIDFYTSLMKTGITDHSLPTIRTALNNLILLNNRLGNSLRLDQRERIEEAVISVFAHTQDSELCDIAYENILNTESSFSSECRNRIFQQLKNQLLDNPKYYDVIRRVLIAYGETLKDQANDEALYEEKTLTKTITLPKKKPVALKFKYKDFPEDYKTAAIEYQDCKDNNDNEGCQNIIGQFKRVILFYVQEFRKHYETHHNDNIIATINLVDSNHSFYAPIYHFFEDMMLHDALIKFDAERAAYLTCRILSSLCPRLDEQFAERMLFILTLCANKKTKNSEDIDRHIQITTSEIILFSIRNPGSISEQLTKRAAQLLAPRLKSKLHFEHKPGEEKFFAYLLAEENPWISYHYAQTLAPQKDRNAEDQKIYLWARTILLAKKDPTFPAKIVTQFKQNLRQLINTSFRDYTSSLALKYIEAIGFAEKVEVRNVDVYLHEHFKSCGYLFEHFEYGPAMAYDGTLGKLYKDWIVERVEAENAKKAAGQGQVQAHPVQRASVPLQTKGILLRLEEKKTASETRVYPPLQVEEKHPADEKHCPSLYADTEAQQTATPAVFASAVCSVGFYPSLSVFETVETNKTKQAENKSEELATLSTFLAATPVAESSASSASAVELSVVPSSSDRSTFEAPRLSTSEIDQLYDPDEPEEDEEDEEDKELMKSLKNLNAPPVQSKNESSKLFSHRRHNETDSSEKRKLIASYS